MEDIYASIHFAPERGINKPWLHFSTGCMAMTPTCTEETVSALRALADHLEEAFQMKAKRAAIEAAMAVYDPTPETPAGPSIEVNSPAEDAAMDALESAVNMVRPPAQVLA
jgi:uncharacterized protein (DUF3084 family)